MISRTTPLIGFAIAALAVLGQAATAAGPRTHAEMGQRAWDRHILETPEMLPGLVEFRTDTEAMRAFYSGTLFPDFGYGGINDDAAEYAHWHPYQQVYLEYLLERFPPPWDAAARREIAFFFGILCHGVGDVPWHFDEDGHKSLLTMAREEDNSGHGFTEHITDIFSHVLFDLEPDVRGNFVWLTRTAQTVFERAGIAVTAEELKRGCRKLEAEWMRGARLGPIVYPYFQAKIPWCRAHFEDYYYGGVDHGAALTAMCIRYYYAQLRGWHYYQNIPIQASAFPRGDPFTPCVDAVIADDGEMETGYLAVGRGAHALLRFDLSNLPPSYAVEHATLWLRRTGEPVSRPMSVTCHEITHPWCPVEADWHTAGPEDAAWPVPGAEGAYTPSPFALNRVTAESSEWLAWDVTGLVRHWVSGRRPNYGVLLKVDSRTETATHLPLRFYSSAAQQARPDGYGGTAVEYRPVLVVR